MRERLYNFNLTESQIFALKAALLHSGLEYHAYRAVYSLLCEAVCTEWDKKELAKYN